MNISEVYVDYNMYGKRCLLYRESQLKKMQYFKKESIKKKYTEKYKKYK